MVGAKEPVSPFGSFLFPHIFRSFRMAVQPSKLAVAFAAVAVICLTGWLMDLSRTVVTAGPPPGLASGRLGDASGNDPSTELALYVASPAQLHRLLESPPLAGSRRMGVFKTLCRFCAVQCRRGNVQGCLSAIAWAFEYHTGYSVIFLAVVLVALSLAGGVICRMTALQFARDEHPRLAEAARFAWARRCSLLAAPVAPFAIAVALGLPIILLGLVGDIPVVGELLTAILLPLALVAGPFIAVVLIGAAAGLNLLWPAIAYDDSDFFDAISRSFSGVYGRPWTLGFYTLLATLYGTICYLFVRLFAFVVLWATRGFLQLGLRDQKLQTIWPAPTFADLSGAFTAPDSWSLWLAAILTRIWVLAIVGLTISFVISLYFSASTILYALMRNRVDGTSLNEIHPEAAETPETTETSE